MATDIEKKHSELKTFMDGLPGEWAQEHRDEVGKRLGELKELKGRLDRAHEDAKAQAEVDALLGGIDLGALKGDEAVAAVKAGAAKSLGDRFVEAPQFKDWLSQVAPTGTIPDSTKGIHSPPFTFAGFKDLVTGLSDTSAGSLVTPDRAAMVDLPLRPLTMRQVVTNGRTGSDAIEYVQVTGYTNNAAPVAEATATAGASGLKPESAMAFTKVTTTVKTIAHWIPATKRALSDAAQVRTLIDAFLRSGLEQELEDQMVTGDGTGENFMGIANTAGVQAQAWDTDILVTTRRARTKVRLAGRAVPTAYLLNPADWESVDLTRNGNGDFYFGGPTNPGQPRLWGLPVVESEAVPAGTGYVGDFRSCVLWDREQASIQVSDSHADFFTRNMVAILAELRAAFGILRPVALVEIDLTAA